MRTHRLKQWWLLFWTALVALPIGGLAHADFILVEDFEDLIPGPIDEQGGWQAASSSSVVTTDPDGGENQVLAVTTESTHLHREVVLLDGTVRMFFLRFRYASQLNISFGLSDVANPSRFDHFESELSLTNATGQLRINDGCNYDVLTVLEPDTWYNCWMLIDNVNNTTQVWLHSRAGEGATAGDQLDAMGQTIFEFRNTNAADLVNFYIKTGGGMGPAGPLYIDDMYLEDTNALNLQNPATTQASVVTADAPSLLARLGSPRPNPLNPTVTIPFSLASAGTAELKIYDAGGRLVRRLAAGTLAAGDHAVAWDGRDDAGRRQPIGQYFCSLEVNGALVGTQKATVIR
jgi:hypothetical protein